MNRLSLWMLDRKVELFRTILRSRYLMRIGRRVPFPVTLNHARLVLHHADAVDALRRERSFGVPYLAKMKQLDGVFMLGLDAGPEHSRLRAAVKEAITPCDVDELHGESFRLAKERLCGRRRIEVVGELTNPVLAATIGGSLGLDHVDQQLLRDGRAVFRHIFINGLDDPRVRERAEAAAPRLHANVGPALARRRKAPQDDILSRLIAGGRLSDKELRDHAVGLFVAWSASVSRGMAFAMDALFKQPEGFALAQGAARQGDRAAMEEVLREAFRFVPPAPAVERVCRREAPVGKRLVRREGDVIVAFTSAMMDERVVAEPGRFRLGRPPRDDLSFGSGAHACLGRELALAQLSGLAIALLAPKSLRWAYGMKLDGPYPHRLEVTW
jgi:cholest-4-en-3-one 26-monooxygenase